MSGYIYHLVLWYFEDVLRLEPRRHVVSSSLSSSELLDDESWRAVGASDTISSSTVVLSWYCRRGREGGREGGRAGGREGGREGGRGNKNFGLHKK